MIATTHPAADRPATDANEPRRACGGRRRAVTTATSERGRWFANNSAETRFANNSAETRFANNSAEARFADKGGAGMCGSRPGWGA